MDVSNIGVYPVFRCVCIQCKTVYLSWTRYTGLAALTCYCGHALMPYNQRNHIRWQRVVAAPEQLEALTGRCTTTTEKGG